MKSFFAILFLILGFLSFGPLVYFGFDGKYGMNSVLNSMSNLRIPQPEIALMLLAVIVIFFRLSFYFRKQVKKARTKLMTEADILEAQK